MLADASELWYIKKDDIATGPHIRSNHGLNLPDLVSLLLSHILPIATSVNESTKRAAIITIPTTPAAMPITSV